ncbi:hypothetical protein JF50_02330 [Pseudoalteromonas luteoviolacea]|uniref:Uncharacterized protein n=1 Tax=Pseudoalteromonas luteoviolacea TaxID=43657 RepID=A0A0C1QDN2_9GAMM|nr:hypothetical protein JF50_02330 [Pseudoalteromonas luteoviolacea]
MHPDASVAIYLACIEMSETHATMGGFKILYIFQVFIRFKWFFKLCVVMGFLQFNNAKCKF